MSGRPQPVPFLDLASQHDRIRDQLDVALKTVLSSERFVGGPEVQAFEVEFAEYCNVAGCVGVGNGTDAMELVLAGLGIGPGDEVIVPTNTFVATAEAVRGVGARPHFVDVLPDTLLIDPVGAEAAIGSRTAAIIAVHMFGQMADVEVLSQIASRHRIALIEDAAQAHGARFAGRRSGSAGVAATYSFYPGKNLGAFGDGGAVVSNDRTLISRIRQLADHGRSPLDRYRHDVSGRNSRLDSLQAAILRVKLNVLDEANANRLTAMRSYRERLPQWCNPVAVHPKAEPVHHLAVVQVPDRAAVTAALDGAQIGWGVHYPIPCHLQTAFAEFAAGELPVAEAAARQILSLPIFPTMSTEQVQRVCDVVCGASR